jgi:hypothetical protein
MKDFISEIIVKMKPVKPKSPSDLEVINDMLSDKFIILHKALITQGARIMATLDQIKAAIVELKAVVADEATEVSTELASLNAKVAALQAELANGTAVSAADLDEVLASINGVSALVEGIIETAAPVEPVLDPVPTEEPLPAE